MKRLNFKDFINRNEKKILRGISGMLFWGEVNGIEEKFINWLAKWK